MWTSIADVLALPGARSPERLLEQVAHRAALSCWTTSSSSTAPTTSSPDTRGRTRAAILTTSRRALAVPGEHLYGPAIPAARGIDSVERRGVTAVELFVQQARSVRADFRLTADNVAESSPSASISMGCRLPSSCPLPGFACSVRRRCCGGSTRTSTLRRGARKRRADSGPCVTRSPGRITCCPRNTGRSSAVGCVRRRRRPRCRGCSLGRCLVGPTARRPLGLPGRVGRCQPRPDVGGPDGEPRITLLETIRSFARGELRDAGELDVVHLAHALHYLQVAERLQRLRAVDHLLALRRQRSSSTTSARPWLGQCAPMGIQAATGTRTPRSTSACLVLGWLWYTGGYVLEEVAGSSRPSTARHGLSASLPNASAPCQPADHSERPRASR